MLSTASFLDSSSRTVSSHVCRWATRHPRPPESVTNCRVGCQRAAPHFDDDSVWRGAFDPFPSFVNKEYTLIDAAHIMAV